ncbi:MAG: TldD/PmbA family protein [Rhodovibrionaceae bacterium]|nr:TldD/PmbA family protein [Rhodovibrionaceae bacterium]
MSEIEDAATPAEASTDMAAMSAEDMLNLLDDVIARAKRAGAEAADALMVEAVSLSQSQRLGKLETLERSEGRDLGLRAIVGKRQACISCSDFKKDALDEAIERAVAMARNVPEDSYCGLADSEALAREWPELDSEDPHEPAPEELIARAAACEEAAMAVEGITNSEGAEASWSRGRIALASSNGFAGSYTGTSHSVGVAVLGGEGLGMERDYDFTSKVYAEDMEDPETIGWRAGEKTVRRLNARQAKTGRYPIVFDPRVANGLLRSFAGAINGNAVARGTSFLRDKMGEAVFASGIALVDDARLHRGLRSKPFDAEGIATARRLLVEDGVLQGWILDLHSARQLGLETTGNASRGTGAPPSPSATNLYMEPGELSPNELMADIAEGFYVTEMMGHGINMVTGDYSRGAAGFWIEQGQIAYPVSGVTVAGNLKDMFANMRPANDLELRYGVDSPTLRVEGMTLAGN